MKKILSVLILLCLFGCSLFEEPKDPLEEIGYSLDDVQIIKTFPENIQTKFLNEYNSAYIDLMHSDGFVPNYLDDYLKYYDMFDKTKLFYLVNNKIINETNSLKLSELYNNEYYLYKNEDLYLEYLNNYDSVRECIEVINTKRYLDYYTEIENTDLNKDYLMLINKYHALSSDFEPDDLVDIDSKYGRGVTRAAVYEAYKQMSDDALEAGCDFWICSAYRSYDTQEVLYNRYLIEEGGDQSIVDTYSARPGHSEHQSGLCLDLYDTTYGMEGFGNSESSKWINENCYKYGFIVRYTKEKENITGYEAEPWQVRYVGSAEIAKDIMDRNITFDEYYACFVE